jgi:hypothetical protein
MVEQDGDIVAIVDVLAHRSTIQYAASGGELNPKEIEPRMNTDRHGFFPEKFKNSFLNLRPSGFICGLIQQAAKCEM